MCFLGLTGVHIQNGISTGSAIFAQCKFVTDRQTYRQTDHATPSLGLTIGCIDTERWCGLIIIITTYNIITCMWSFRSNYLHYSWIFTAAESETWLADLVAVVGFAAVHEPPLRTHLWNDNHQHSSHDNMTQSTTVEQHCTNKVLQFLPARHAWALAVVVCLSVISRCSTEMAKRRIMQTMPHDSAGTLVSCCQKSPQKLNGVTPNWGIKCRWGTLNGGAVAANWRLSTGSIVNSVRSQFYHTEHPPYLFAARSPWCSTDCLMIA